MKKVADTTKAAVRRMLSAYLTGTHEPAKERNKWNCNGCGSHDALHFYADTDTWKCYSCERGGDIFALYAVDKGLYNDRDFERIAAELAQKYGIPLDYEHTEDAPTPTGAQREGAQAAAPAKREEATTDAAQTPDYTDYCRQAAENLQAMASPEAQQVRDYLFSRCISRATAAKFGLGAAVLRGKTAVIIPSGKSYNARIIDPGEGQAKYHRPSGSSVSPLEALQDGQEHQQPCWFVEGEFNALAIYQVGGSAVAIGGAGNVQKAVEYAQRHRHLAPFVLAFDPDKAGQEATEKALAAMQKANIDCYAYPRAEGDTRDINEIQQADLVDGGGELVGMVQQAQSWQGLSVRAIQELQRLDGAAAFKRAVRDIQAGRYSQSIATPFGWLNNELHGGFHPGLVVLGATTGAGKTTFALQIAAHIADYGRRVLYISLEMSAVELYTRIISSRLADLRRYDNYPQLTALELRKNPTRWQDSPEVCDTIQKIYQNIAPRFNVQEGIGNFSALQVAELASYYAIQDKAAPVVVVDYLQMLAPMDARQTDKQATDASIRTLKRLSRDLNTVVIAISSYNRSSYSGDASLSAFKESGGIEYTSDLVLALEAPQDAEQDGGDTRDVTLTCLKNRNGRRFKLPYEYRPAFNHFKEQNPGKLERMQPNATETEPKRSAGRGRDRF